MKLAMFLPKVMRDRLLSIAFLFGVNLLRKHPQTFDLCPRTTPFLVHATSNASAACSMLELAAQAGFAGAFSCNDVPHTQLHAAGNK